ncbi:winged helix-turn-helix domain-containing protein [Klebsiella aerogenes]|uniref:winged helix-turn-helix domain-containing protein n=1 Tax=Klebsiella aerogenes TaxID=548 RepID=UPI0028E046D6|nr:winged helix-turn-helix domain-containing protein [Klebsiella aerogenes]MDT8880989.1 winged helix-turn-helix domain-containing protein [Klebsiella aerogenes]
MDLKEGEGSVNSEVYLIDGLVSFDRERMILTNTISNDTVTLTPNLAECLVLLLSNQGDVISQEYFINEVWGKKRMFISENTLVQNIRKLRGFLHSIGLRKDYIVTQKGKGYYFSNEVEVILFEHSEEFTNEKSSEEQKIVYYIKNHLLSVSFESLKIKVGWFFIFPTIVFIICIYLYNSCFINSIPIIKYSYSSTLDKCNIYFDNKLEYDKLNLIDIIIRQNKIDCRVSSFIYITFYPLSAHYSYIKCDRDIESMSENKTCTSVVRYNYAKDV